MKIVYLLNSYADGGAEHGLATLVERGFFRGHDLTIYALVKGSGWVFERLCNAVGSERVLHFSEGETVGVRQACLAVPRLIGIIRRMKPDILFMSLPQANLAGRLAALPFPKIHTVSFEHSVTYRRHIARAIMRVTAWRVNTVLYDSEETWIGIQDTYGSGWRGAAIFTPLTILRCKNRPPKPKGIVVQIFCAGRLSPEKNHESLIRAVRLLLDEGHQVALRIAGEGPERPRLEDLIRELDLDRHVILLGFLKNCDPERAACHVYAQVSVREGLCLSVLEAMAEGLLVMATNVGAIQRYGLDGMNMIKATQPSPQAISEALARALGLIGRDSAIREEAVTTINKHFSEAVVRQLWDKAREELKM